MPVARLGAQRVGERRAGVIAPDDVRLEVNRSLRGSNGVEPCGVVLGRIPKQADAVPGHERPARGAPESLLEQAALGRPAFDDRVEF